MKGQLVFYMLLLGAPFGFVISRKPKRTADNGFAVAKQFPYQVYYDVLDLSNLEEPITWTGACSGTFIYKRIILTAAHCFTDKPNIYAIKIYFGAVDKSNSSEIGQQQLVVKISNVIIHNEFDPSTLFNDIAVIKLPIDVASDEYIKPAQLPAFHTLYATSKAIASGWGAVKDNDTLVDQPKLKYFRTSLLLHDECRKRLKKGVTMKIADSQICIAPSENTECIGDSGGSLTVQDNDKPVLIGILSYCTINGPSVYTRVASYNVWLQENVAAHNLYE